jgi:hypothetical protein
VLTIDDPGRFVVLAGAFHPVVGAVVCDIEQLVGEFQVADFTRARTSEKRDDRGPQPRTAPLSHSA